MSISSSGSGYATSPPAQVPPLASPRVLAPVALVNGTPTFQTFNTPNDGVAHAYAVAVSVKVTSAETGGSITLSYTRQGTVFNIAIVNGGQPANISGSAIIEADPGTAITVSQATALTVGAATLSSTITPVN